MDFRNKLAYSFLLKFIVCYTFTTLAQDITVNINAINQAYEKRFDCYTSVKYKVYQDFSSEAILFSQDGSICKRGSSTIQLFDQTTCINTNSYTIIADNESKEIVYTKKITSSENTLNYIDLDLELITQLSKSFKYSKPSTNIHQIEFEFGQEIDEFQRIVIQFNPKTFWVNKIIVYCSQTDINENGIDYSFASPRIEIEYAEIKHEKKPSEQEFTFQKYLIKKGHNFELKPEYKDFQLTVLTF